MITSKKKRRIKKAKRKKRAERLNLRSGSTASLSAYNADAARYNIPDPSLYANQAELYRRVPAVSTAVDMISGMMKSSVLRVYRLDGEEKIAIENHELETLLANPNELDSAAEFVSSTSNFRVLAGNAYWWLNRANENSKPDEIWVIPPQYMKPVPDGNLSVRGYIYDMHDGTPPLPLEAWEVVHFKRPNPFNRYIGLSVIESLIVTALGDIESRKWLTRFYGANDGQPAAVIAFADMISDPEWKRLNSEFKKAGRDKKAMMMRGVGKGGVEWMKAGVTPSELAFLDGLESNKETVYNVIAPGLSSMLAVNSNEANARVGEAIFRNMVIYPAHVEMAAKITQTLLIAYGDNLVAEYDDVRVIDRALEFQEIAQYERTHTIDEVRMKYYQGESLGDERGKLFVSQVSRNSSFKVAEEITATPTRGSAEEAKPEETIKTSAKPKFEIDLDKWKRKASKRVGEKVPFESKYIPQAVKSAILYQLPRCKTAIETRSLFDSVLEKYAGKSEDSEISKLVSILETSIKAMVDESEN